MFPQKVTIVGVGCMGGSLGLAMKRFCPEVRVTGVDVNREALAAARSRGAIDDGTSILKAGVEDAELVFISAPIHSIVEILKRLPGIVRSDALITDLGSTKVEICKTAEKVIPNQFIGGHPMTGSELQGIKGADPYLFENAIYLLTPSKPNDKKLNKLKNFLEKLGAKVISISPKMHDEVAAYVSHLPQLLAVALTVLISEKNARQPLIKELAAGGFRDLTRIASSPYAVWHDILESNSPAVKKALDDLIKLLQIVRSHLGRGPLKDYFKRALDFREKLPMRRKGFIKPLHRIAVSVKDEPGALAHLTALLANANVNISDIELMKVREGFGGTFQLYFANEKDAERATETLRKSSYESRVID